MTNIHDIDYSAFDRPEIVRFLFYPRPEWDLSVNGSKSIPLSIPVADDINIGGQFYKSALQAPNILFFHGNGEIASDYIDFAPFFTERGINFIPVDYRGYGRSSGSPTVSSMMEDCHAVFAYLKTWLKENGFTGPFVIMGRSLGSASALELAERYQDQIDGLIIESGFAYIEPLLALLGVNMASLGITEDRAFRNIEKMKSFEKTTLVIHSQYDHIIAIAEGRDLYEACPAKDKRFLTIAGANHNNVFLAGLNDYMNAIEWLIGRIENRDE